MRKTIFTPHRVLIGTVILLLASSFLPSRWAVLLWSRPRHLIAAALAPADHLLKPLADSLRRPPELPVHLGNREEYERATQQIVELQYRLSQATERIAELTQIRNELQLVGVGLMPATVTAWSGDRMHPALTINRGSRHGLNVGLAVTRGFHLLGRVVDTGAVTSTVRLITAPKSHLVVLLKPPIQGEEPRQMITQLESATGKNEFWARTNADDPVRIGDLAQLYDDAWPDHVRGFVIGKVTAIDKHPDDPTLRRRVVVSPIRSLAHLDHVTVIVPTSDTNN